MALLFQPRWSGVEARHAAYPPGGVATDRGAVLLAALEAVLLGDPTDFGDLFTDDVVFTSPHLVVESVSALEHAIGDREESLSDVEILVLTLDGSHDRLSAEWRLQAVFTGPVMFDDRLLIEPTGGGVHLPGASFADFRGPRICAFRHYFDDSELLGSAPGTASHLRWVGDY